MKITFAISTIIAIAATGALALPTDQELSARAAPSACTSIQYLWFREHYFSTLNAAKDDRHSFRLIVHGQTPPFDETLPYRKTTGDPSTNYRETRSGTINVKWRVTHTDDPNDGIVLTLTSTGQNITQSGPISTTVTKDATKSIVSRGYRNCVNWVV
ncbi:hypothetical protein EC991_003308 [Linnemannia zychae]|nr:hypothetical protein EC991_003308 [Linnemannia zychae]